MAELPFMPVATDALLSDAGDLPNELFGAYCRLLFRWWREGAQPEPNERRLARWAGLTVAQFDEIKEFLTETPEGWIQSRLRKTHDQISERRAKAKKAAEMRWQCERNANAYASASENECERICERNANYNYNHNQSSILTDADNGAAAPPEKPDKPKAKARAPVSRGTPREALEGVLTPEDADEVLRHRSRLRKPLTERAARLLAAEFAKCRDGPAAAVEMMLLKGWIGFRADWYENERADANRHPGGPSGQSSRYERFLRGDPLREADDNGTGSQSRSDFGVIEGGRARGLG